MLRDEDVRERSMVYRVGATLDNGWLTGLEHLADMPEK
jgi:hypothetical protein